MCDEWVIDRSLIFKPSGYEMCLNLELLSLELKYGGQHHGCNIIDRVQTKLNPSPLLAMTNLLLEAFARAKDLSEDLQNELAQYLLEDIENEMRWQQQLSQPQSSILDKLAAQALAASAAGKTHVMGFDEL
jgi:hypothetical protein